MPTKTAQFNSSKNICAREKMKKISYFTILVFCAVSFVNLQTMKVAPAVVVINRAAFQTVTPEGIKHFCAIQKIKELLWKLINTELQKQKETRPFSWVEYPLDELNSNFDQTLQGLILVVVNDIPVELKTPWGKVKLVGAGCYRTRYEVVWRLIMSKLLELITVEPYIETSTNHENYRCVYNITSVDGVDLPMPFALNRLDPAWMENYTAETVWASLELTQ